MTGESELLAIGEVHTGLVQNSTALPEDRVVALLDHVVGERVRRSERPIPYAVSPERLTGVDCRLPSSSGRDTRCVGTVMAHTSITGGHVVQGSAFTRILPARAGRRLPWSHYLARPGTVEAIGKVDPDDAAAGFVGPARAGELDLGAISARLVDGVQATPLLDRRVPFRRPRTSLRWVVQPAEDDGAARAAFSIDSRTTRTLRMRVAVGVGAATVLCEDLALHDWLLTTLVSLMEAGFDTPGTRAQRMQRLRPAVDHLLHLWMPAARVDECVLPLWRALDARTGFSRQWQACVERIRDQVILGAVALLQATTPVSRP